MQLTINGKFLSVRPTGVHRVARELIQAVDRIRAAQPVRGDQIEILAPRNAGDDLALSTIAVRRAGALSGVLGNIPWEHLDLRFHKRSGLTLNLCNTGSVLDGRAITMIHDAQVYITPESYSKPFRLWYRILQPLLARRAKRVLTVSHYSKQQIARFGVVAEDKIDVIHNGCDHVLAIAPDEGAVAAFGLSPGGYVLALSSTQAHKNIAVLLRAFASGPLRDMKLVLFGAQSRADFEAAGLVVPDNVVFTGRISDGALVGLLKGACAYACPSRTEGFGLPPLEAMAVGCPVVIAPCGALPEVCGTAAVQAGPDEPEQWAAALRRIADDAGFREERIRAGLQQASLFTWASAAQKLLAVVERCR